MSSFDDAWFERFAVRGAALPEVPGATARITYELTGADAPTFHVHLTDGRVAEVGPGADEDADFTMIVRAPDYLSSLRGELDLTVGFMRGSVKVVGNVGRMLSVLPVTGSSEWRELGAALLDA